jgi:hypothetical protein
VALLEKVQRLEHSLCHWRPYTCYLIPSSLPSVMLPCWEQHICCPYCLQLARTGGCVEISWRRWVPLLFCVCWKTGGQMEDGIAIQRLFCTYHHYPVAYLNICTALEPVCCLTFSDVYHASFCMVLPCAFTVVLPTCLQPT